jgi:hypothetical protein
MSLRAESCQARRSAPPAHTAPRSEPVVGRGRGARLARAHLARPCATATNHDGRAIASPTWQAAETQPTYPLILTSDK